jgi:hypothetical protein
VRAILISIDCCGNDSNRTDLEESGKNLVLEIPSCNFDQIWHRTHFGRPMRALHDVGKGLEPTLSAFKSGLVRLKQGTVQAVRALKRETEPGSHSKSGNEPWSRSKYQPAAIRLFGSPKLAVFPETDPMDSAINKTTKRKKNGNLSDMRSRAKPRRLASVEGRGA